MTDNFEKKVAVDGPVVNAGELGSSTFSPGQALPAGPLGLGQRWTVARKREVVLRLLRDEPVQLLSRQLGVEIFRLEQWREKAIGGIDASLKQRKGDPVQAELDSAMKRIGELTMQVELLEAKTETFGPLGRRRSRRSATSPGTGLAYGLRRVCAAWGMARSSFYAMTSGQHAEQPPAKRRGPKPAISDQPLVAIEADLEASPWEGEGSSREADARIALDRSSPKVGHRACSRWRRSSCPVSAGMSGAATASPPCSRSWLSTAPSICQIKFWGIASRPTPSSPSPRPTASPSGNRT